MIRFLLRFWHVFRVLIFALHVKKLTCIYYALGGSIFANFGKLTTGSNWLLWNNLKLRRRSTLSWILPKVKAKKYLKMVKIIKKKFWKISTKIVLILLFIPKIINKDNFSPLPNFLGRPEKRYFFHLLKHFKIISKKN